MDGKLNLRVNKYETKVFRDTLSPDSIANSYMIGAGEGWGYMFARWAEAGMHGFDRNWALVDENSPHDPVSNPYISPNTTVLRYQPNLTPGMSAAERAATVDATKAQQDAALAAIFNPANRPDEDLITFWNQDLTFGAEEGWGAGGKAWAGTPAMGIGAPLAWPREVSAISSKRDALRASSKNSS